MKGSVIFMLFILRITYCLSHDNDSIRKYLNHIEYGLISENVLFMPIFDEYNMIKSIKRYAPLSVDKLSEYSTYTQSWDYVPDTLLTIRSDGEDIYRKIFSEKYICEMKSKYPEKEDWLLITTRFTNVPFYLYINSFLWSSNKKETPFIPPSYLKQELKRFINFDVKIRDHNHLTFYMRDHRSFSVYILTMEKCSNDESPKTRDILNCWDGNRFYIAKEKIVDIYPPLITADKGRRDIIKESFISKGYPPYKYLSRYFTDRHIGSITDSVFFNGNFKIIEQKQNTYIINLHNGYIFRMDPGSILFIGKFNLTKYPLISKRIFFIEDRDKENIIIFAPVEWVEEVSHPLPEIKIINIQEIKEKFGI